MRNGGAIRGTAVPEGGGTLKQRRGGGWGEGRGVEGAEGCAGRRGGRAALVFYKLYNKENKI